MTWRANIFVKCTDCGCIVGTDPNNVALTHAGMCKTCWNKFQKHMKEFGEKLDGMKEVQEFRRKLKEINNQQK